MKYQITSTDKNQSYSMTGNSIADAIRTINLNAIPNRVVASAFADTVHIYKVYANGDRESVARAHKVNGKYKRF